MRPAGGRPIGFQWPQRPGVQVDAWRLAAPARRQREATLERLVTRVVAGENLLLLCHCRGRGKPVQADTLCHGDGIAAELGRRAAAQVARAVGQARGVAAGAGEPLASERARAADGDGGGRRVAARLDEASALRDAILGEARAAGCGGAGAASAAAAGEQSSAGEAAGAATPIGSATGGAGGKRSRGEAGGDAEAATGGEKRQRRARGGKTKGHNQRAEERAAKRGR